MAKLTAILGPTNTGKTHLAIETLVEHRSGVIGLPLRLLAREVYERLVLRLGRERCALVTGEEKIVPSSATHFACTVEAMPEGLDGHGGGRAFDVVAIDEIQLCGDRERGHIFTDRLLRRRGTHETLVMGSDTMAGPLRRLFGSELVVERRPRLSQLSHSGSKKLSRLPKRSAVVAFSIADVYAIAEELRHHHGGCAVVTGALSPATRNAQVAMFQAGEVDVLVATDAIGMGLNLDIEHVAFAANRKFDGDTVRALTEQEIAQIAGRAGRHLKDGSFGVTRGLAAFDDDVVDRVCRHNFPPQETLCLRQSDLDMRSVDALLSSLRAPPRAEDFGFLVSGRPASDVLALERLRHHPLIIDSVRSAHDVEAFFAVCQIPDFVRIAPDDHAALIATVWSMVHQGGVSDDWLAERSAALDRSEGDVDTLVARLDRVRTLSYICHKPAWVKNHVEWQAQTRALEDRLSDALHHRLTQRFVDKLRTVVKGGRVAASVTDDGGVSVAGEKIGTLQGLRFIADATAVGDAGGDSDVARRRLQVAAAAKGLSSWVEAKLQELVAAADDAVVVDTRDLVVRFHSEPVGRLVKGRSRLWPKALPLTDGVVVDDGAWRQRLEDKLTAVTRRFVERSLPALCAIDVDALPQQARAMGHALQQGLGICDRRAVEADAGVIDDVAAKKALRRARVRLGFVDAFTDDAFKDRAIAARAALVSVWRGLNEAPPLPPSGASSFDIGERPRGFVEACGFVVVDVAVDDRADRAVARAFRRDLVDDVLVLMKAVPLPGPVPASAMERLG